MLWAILLCAILPCIVHSSTLLTRDSLIYRVLCRIWSHMHDFIRRSLGEGKISYGMTSGLGLAHPRLVSSKK